MKLSDCRAQHPALTASLPLVSPHVILLLPLTHRGSLIGYITPSLSTSIPLTTPRVISAVKVSAVTCPPPISLLPLTHRGTPSATSHLYNHYFPPPHYPRCYITPALCYITLAIVTQRDPIGYINQLKTLDPALADLPPALLAAAAPSYRGMRHPPPARPSDPAQCQLPWEAPFLDSYAAAPQYGRTLALTMCNW